MDSCYSGDYIAGDHIHTDITICNIEEPQQEYRLGTVIYYRTINNLLINRRVIIRLKCALNVFQ